MKRFHLLLAVLAVASAICTLSTSIVPALVLLTLVSLCLNTPRPRCCAVTLSVPEILGDILSAFKAETPELFGPNGFATDFSSDTARLGDKITAKIEHVPTVADYDANNGGFKNGAEDVTTLIEDVPLTLNQLKHVPVKVGYLTALATKGVPLYKAAVANIGFALGKLVVDQVLTQAVSGNVTNSFPVVPAITSLDTFESLRGACNSQRMAASGRFCFLNTTLAGALGADQRVQSELYYGQRNGEQGLRLWKNMCGFSWIREYPDFPAGAGNIGGLAADRRLVCVAVRNIKDISTAAKELGIRGVMRFDTVTDKESGLDLCGVSWQDAPTGDVFLSAALLFGVGVGNQGGMPGTMTDYAGCVIRTS